MGRLRLVFALLAVALAVPTGLLVRRALESVEVEQQVRQRTLAERVFDEMERSLSAFLAAEEERPFEQYRFFYVPQEAVGRGLVRSPLSHPDAGERWPFVVGHFQVDPDQSVHTPLEPRPDEREHVEGGWVTPPELAARISLVRAAASAGLAPLAGRRNEGLLGTAAPAPQAPGTTIPLGGKPPLASAPEAVAQNSPESAPGAYDALRSLNLGAEARKERSRKVAVQKLEVADASSLRDDRAGPAEAAESDEAYDLALEEEAAPATPSAAVARAPARIGRPSAAAPEPAAGLSSVLVAVDPLIGREVPGGERLLLYRTVLVGDRGYRQGLVLDRLELEGWLRDGVLGSASLSAAALAFGPVDATEPAKPAYHHRFAEPFDGLQATLALPALDDSGGARTVRWLSFLLLGAGALGLFALYRMVALTVGFAERRSNFVAAVSHELKTPLTAIRMYAEMLRDGMVPSPEKRQEYYGTITAESERLSRLIQNVLEFSRLERGSRDVELVVGSLGPLALEAAQVLGPHAEREGFRLEVDVPGDLPPVRFDRDALLQVLFNLVDNALKYARDASDRTIRIEGRVEQGGVRLAVRDAGPGVPEGQLSRIFEPFYRPGDELTRSSQGAGIGLALVRELSERMGAALRGVNVSGGGFEVSLLLRAA
jgi:signal transduction histidine kinase